MTVCVRSDELIVKVEGSYVKIGLRWLQDFVFDASRWRIFTLLP